MAEEPAVLYEAKDQIAQITLNRPENRNSMTPDVLDGFANAVGQVKTDPDVRWMYERSARRSRPCVATRTSAA